MKFINKTGKSAKVQIMENKRIGGTLQACHWITVKPNDIVDISEQYGLNLGFTPVGKDEPEEQTEPEQSGIQMEPEEPEKEEPDPTFIDKLKKLKGIGKKTLDDILKLFSNEKDLKNALKDENAELPFRDDVAKVLKKKFGK